MPNKMFQIKLTQKYKEMGKRFSSAPKLLEIYIDAMLKSTAEAYIKIFQEGLKKNRFQLDPLKFTTIAVKKAKGYKRPRSPLYGKGEDDNKTLFNALLIKKIKSGWRVYPRWAKHHEANMQIRQLLYIHENGCLIKRGTSIIRIPPRPVLKKAYNKLMTLFVKSGEAKKISEILSSFIKNGEKSGFKKVKKHEINN
jgi:hypothetical protein